MFPEELLQFLRKARYIVALTGAGVSAESGVPTFRDAQTGLWSKYRPEELATPEAFHTNPRMVWEWYAWRSELVKQVTPNPGHCALAALEKLAPKFTLLTQNVDNLHQIAGSQNVIELHGNIRRYKCFDQQHLVAHLPESSEIPPRCPLCNSLLRPDVVWFGENLPQEALESALMAATTCDAFFSVGTSGMVEPAASLPFLALRQGAVVVEINPESTPLSPYATYTYRGKSGEILPQLIKAL